MILKVYVKLNRMSSKRKEPLSKLNSMILLILNKGSVKQKESIWLFRFLEVIAVSQHSIIVVRQGRHRLLHTADQGLLQRCICRNIVLVKWQYYYLSMAPMGQAGDVLHRWGCRGVGRGQGQTGR